MQTSLKTMLLLAMATFATSVTVAQKLPTDLLPIDTTREVLVKSSRYKIVQSTLGALATFKLDSYSGVIYQLKSNPDSNDSWEHVTRIAGSLPDTWYINRKNYSLLASTIGMRFIYLLNVHTRATWQFVVDTKTKESFFLPMVTN